MRFLTKNKVFLSVISTGIIVSFTFVGIAQCYKHYGDHVSSLFISGSSNYSRAIMVVDRMAKRLFPENIKKIPFPDKPAGKKKKRVSGLLLFVLSAIIIYKENNLILFIIATALLSLKVIKALFKRRKKILIPPELKFYNWWVLKFLSPLQKCIMNRSDEYDINPVRIYGELRISAVKTRTLFKDEQSAGFFYD